MKYHLISKLIILLLSFWLVKVNALDCSPKELNVLNQEAKAVKVNYEEVIEYVSGYGPPEGYEGDPADFKLESSYFKINILNLTSKLYLKIKNEETNFERKINFSNTTNGKYSFNWRDLNKVNTLKYTIYANTPNCYGTKIKASQIRLPKYNWFQDSPACQQAKGFELCEKYIWQNIDEITFNRNIKDYLKRQKESQVREERKPESKINRFWRKNKYYLLGGIGGGVILISLVVGLVIKKKKEQIVR